MLFPLCPAQLINKKDSMLMNKLVAAPLPSLPGPDKRATAMEMNQSVFRWECVPHVPGLIQTLRLLLMDTCKRMAWIGLTNWSMLTPSVCWFFVVRLNH